MNRNTRLLCWLALIASAAYSVGCGGSAPEQRSASGPTEPPVLDRWPDEGLDDETNRRGEMDNADAQAASTGDDDGEGSAENDQDAAEPGTAWERIDEGTSAAGGSSAPPREEAVEVAPEVEQHQVDEGLATEHSAPASDAFPTRDAHGIRLLKPEELDAKTQSVFSTEWTVEVDAPQGGDGGGEPVALRMNGFTAFAGNLNGIDYDAVTEYSQVGSAVYITTHEKLCSDLTTTAFADPAARANFFVAADADATFATDAEGIEANLQNLLVRMYGRTFDAASPEYMMLVSLYQDLEAASDAQRAGKHPMELTVSALCFTSGFVHTL